MANFSFDEGTHTYRLDGKVVPSITQLIKPLSPYDGIPKHILDNAANFGTAIHKLIELEETCTLAEDDLDDADGVLRRVLTTYRKWREHVHPEHTPACEIPMVHPKLGFAGTPDLIFDGIGIVELKTRDVDMLRDPIQTAGQELLWLANGGAKGDYYHAVLTLKADGRHKFTEFTKAQKKEGLSRFRYLLDYHKMHTNIQSWREK